MQSTHGHEDWDGNNYPSKEHKETLGNGTSIHVIVRQLSADKYEADGTVYDADGKVLSHQVKTREQDPGPAAEVLKFAVDETKRKAGGFRGATPEDHHQATPI